MKIWEKLKDSLWVFLKDTWVVRRVYPVYRRNICRFIRKITEFEWNKTEFKQSIKEREYLLYKKRRYHKLKNENFTIIASNCVGTIIYYDLGLRYLSPTINLTIPMNEFVKMVENLKWYIEQEIVEIEKELYDFPVGLLGDIRIYFVHYKTFEEAVSKWEERKQRINWDNLFIIGTERGECSYETIERFEKLPYKNKVILTHKEYPEFQSAHYLKGFKNELGIVTDYKNQFLTRRYIDCFDYVSFLNGQWAKGKKM